MNQEDLNKSFDSLSIRHSEEEKNSIRKTTQSNNTVTTESNSLSVQEEEEKTPKSEEQEEVSKKKVIRKIATKETAPTMFEHSRLDSNINSQFSEIDLNNYSSFNSSFPDKNKNLKRRATFEMVRDDLKQVKMDVDSLKEKEKLIPVVFRPQRTYSQETKKKAIELSLQLGSLKVSAITGIPESSLRRWSLIGPKRAGKSGRKSTFVVIEDKLLAEFKDLRQKGIPVSNSSLKKISQQLAEKEGEKNFVPTEGWLRGFRRRNHIVCRRRTRVSQKLSVTAKRDLQDFQQQILQLMGTHHYPKEAIVNIDEVGVQFDMPSNYTFEHQVITFLT